MSCNGTKLALEQCSRSALETNTQNSDEKCNSSEINSETQKFFCNFDFRLSSEERENINSKMPATATIRIVLSSHNDTTTIIIINNNTTVVKNGPSILHSIITAIASIIGAAIMAFMGFCICKKGCKKRGNFNPEIPRKGDSGDAGTKGAGNPKEKEPRKEPEGRELNMLEAEKKVE